MAINGPICQKDRVEAKPAVIVWRCPKCEELVNPPYNARPLTDVIEELRNVTEQLRRATQAQT